jgi:uncharacterized lipoprotein YbaY
MLRNQFGFPREFLVAVCCGLLALALNGCGGGHTDDKMLTLRGLATYRERMAVSATARLEVDLLDMTNVGATPEILGRTSVENAGQVPIGFVITINASKFDRGHTYALRASIFDQGELLFTTPEPQGVNLEKLDGLLEVVMTRAQ